MPIVPGDLRGQDFEVTEIGIIFWLWKNKLAFKKCCSQHSRRMRIAKTKAKKKPYSTFAFLDQSKSLYLILDRLEQ
jgi:hypothetical protein